MPSTVPRHRCLICEAPGAKACDRCKSSHYCSRDCQLDDWPVHKLLCASFSQFDTTTRASDTHFRGFLFPTDERKPQLIWIECPWTKDEDEGRWQHAKLEQYLGSGGMPKCIPIQTDAILQRQLPDTIDICYRDTFLIDGSRHNQSAEKIAATVPGTSHDWRGPILVVGMNGQGLDPHECRDLDMTDLRYIADYLIAYARWPLDLVIPRGPTGRNLVKGVRINCLGDQKALGKPPYEAVDILSTDPIFNPYHRDTSQIADRIGLPIFTRRLPVSLRWNREKGQNDFGGLSPSNNQDATFLHLCCDPTAGGLPSGSSWAFEDWQLQTTVGSVLVVRRDKKPLAPLHVEALCTYCRHDIRPLMAHTIGEYYPDEPLTKEFVLQYICRQTFSVCWYKLLDKKVEETAEVSAPFPYHV